MRWGQCIYAALSTSSVSLRLTASPHRGSHCPLRRANPSGAPRQLPLTRGALVRAHSKASPPRGGGSAKAETERLCRKETTSQSASQTAPLEGEPSGMRPIFAEKAVRALVKGERM